jgi:hypothetical protein
MSITLSRARNLPTYQCRLPRSTGSPVNFEAAKAPGLTVSDKLLALADEVIE